MNNTGQSQDETYHDPAPGVELPDLADLLIGGKRRKREDAPLPPAAPEPTLPPSPGQTDESLRQIAVDWIRALSQSMYGLGKVRQEDWWSTIGAAIKTAATGAPDWPAFVGMSAGKALVDVLTPKAAEKACSLGRLLSPADYGRLRQLIRRDCPYLLAMATMQRDSEREERAERKAAQAAEKEASDE